MSIGEGAFRSFGGLVALLVVSAACTTAVDPISSARTSAVTTTSAPSASGPPSPVVELGQTVTLEPPADGSFRVRGAYPHVSSECVDAEQPRLEARYPGRLTVTRTDDGSFTLTATLSFERYLEGIAEVPPSWPRAALEAQAIAARSYALASIGWRGEEGEALSTPICATASCQVYRGIPLERPGSIKPWIGAVRRTRGQVLLFDGRPATTLYFSTSNGRTYANEDIFGGSALPYLRGVPEHDDTASPTSRWSVRIGSRHLARFLAREDLWPADRRISSVSGGAEHVRVRGGGTSTTLEASSFRAAINTWAPCLEPKTYPSDRLPLTIPSRWMSVSSANGAVLVHGRGWGHGVGMVQWGAYGKAKRGRSAAQILAAYYGGLRPERFPEPGLIRVQIATGLTLLRIMPSGPGALIDGEPFGPAAAVFDAG
ncbi:MAG: SpoIID/LytB domain-containing protein [Actinomycetota bacterium]